MDIDATELAGKMTGEGNLIGYDYDGNKLMYIVSERLLYTWHPDDGVIVGEWMEQAEVDDMTVYLYERGRGA
jgi:hypothetical protein